MALAAGVLNSVAAPAVADGYIDCNRGNGVCGPDDDTHYWCFGDSVNSDNLRMSYRWSVSNMEDRTIMNGLQTANCHAYTDVRFQSIDLPPYMGGRYNCTRWAGEDHPAVCAAASVSLDLDEIQRAGNDPSVLGSDGTIEAGEFDLNRDVVACHEFGHSLGLFHHDFDYFQDNPTDCMINPWIEPERDGPWRRYNEHHSDHINNFIRGTTQFGMPPGEL